MYAGLYNDMPVVIMAVIVNNVGLSGSNPDKLEYINLSEDVSEK